MAAEQRRVCVTGGTGFIASSLIKQLLLRGYAVNATVRDPDNTEKVGHLKQLQSLGTLNLFRAELTEEGSFDAAVSGCVYVFLVAAPVNIAAEDPENEVIKPAIRGTLNVMKSCLKAKNTVERIVLTSSAAAVSMKKLEGSGVVMDEEAWSDVDHLSSEKPPTWGYAVSKVMVEKEAFRFAEENNLSLVTLLPTLNLGPALAADYISMSLPLGISLLSGNEELINGFKLMQAISGSISMAHVEDTCRAHIFVAENKSASGRYICCSINTSLPELSRFLAERYPQYKVPTNFDELPEKSKVMLSSEKLIKAGFEFKYKMLGEIYDDVVEYAKVAGLLPKET
ncbi:anthocyanidin reductase [Canna indica]|uniref:Anthocyanidin reductase n=1 Tax=Canna indica TaxID=4628 RepID=A0AAQ3L0M9_9LILI|nr:anthocyanidin reductase [Canna indica]